MKKENEPKVAGKTKIDISKIDDEFVINMSNNQKKQQEQILRERARKRAEKKKKARRIISLIMTGFFTVTILVIMCVFGLTSPNFNITSITVIDNEKLKAEEIIEISNLELGINIFKITSRKVENEIKNNPYIEDVKVQKKYPTGIEIYVREREAVYAVSNNEKYIYIDDNGYLLEETGNNARKLLVIEGVELDPEYNLGEQIDVEYLEILHFFKSVFAIANEYGILDYITAVDIGDEQNYYINMGDIEMEIYLGDTGNLNTKMMYIDAILRENFDTPGIIFVNGNFDQGFKAYFRRNV